MRRYIDAAKRRDFESAYACFADDIVARVPGRSDMAGELNGRDAVIAYIEKARALSHGDVSLEVVDMLTSGDRFALLLREIFHRDGGDVVINRANVYRVADDQITEIWIYEGNQYEVDALIAAGAGG